MTDNGIRYLWITVLWCVTPYTLVNNYQYLILSYSLHSQLQSQYCIPRSQNKLLTKILRMVRNCSGGQEICNG
jgi:hypothetical protein